MFVDMQLDLPDKTYRRVKKAAEAEGVSLDYFIASAVDAYINKIRAGLLNDALEKLSQLQKLIDPPARQEEE